MSMSIEQLRAIIDETTDVKEQPGDTSEEVFFEEELLEAGKKERTLSDVVSKNKWVKLISPIMDDPGLQKEIFDLVQTAYAPLGGHLKIKRPTDIKKEVAFVFAVDVDEDPQADAAVFGKVKPGGMKLTGLGQDGTPAGKKAAMKKWAELLKQGKGFAEVSGAMAHITLNKFGAKSLPEKAVRELLGGKKIEWVGEHPSGKYPKNPHWYKRKIGGESHLKIMVGKSSPAFEGVVRDKKQESLIEEVTSIINEASVSFEALPKTTVGDLFKKLVEAVVDGSGSDIDDLCDALREQGVPEKHIQDAIDDEEVPYIYDESIDEYEEKDEELS